MVGNNTKRNIVLFVIVVLNAGNFADFVHCILNGINLENIINALHNACKSFKSHTRINIRVCKRRIIIVAVVVELSKYIVPKLSKSVTLTAGAAIGRAAAVLFASVKIYFRTRSAGT